MSLLSKPVIHMPNLNGGEWLNSPPLTPQTLRGSVVLVDFWDYSCINCIRTLPYLVEWHRRYADKGLMIIGVHTPEFKFAQHRPQVEKAIQEFGLLYPIVLDNEYKVWDAFANKAWPTKYLVDVQGYIRYMRRGEGGYQDTERAIQQLLQTLHPQMSLPEILPALREEDASGSVCYKPTPELFAGYASGLFGGSLGNPEGYAPNQMVVYALPAPQEREENQFFIEGIWQARPEALAFAGRETGRVILPYSAAGVNAVLSPSSDEVELRLGLHPPYPENTQPVVEVKVNGRYLHPHEAGGDIHFQENGISFVPVTRPRMYHLVKHHYYESHELELIFRAPGLALYSFSFTTCVKV